MSVTAEQLGFNKGDALPPPVLQPPSKYPLLDYKPQSFTITDEVNYLLELKKDFAEFLRESPYNVHPIVTKKDIDRYSDRYQDMTTDKTSYDVRYDWSMIPGELKPASKKRKAQDSKNVVNKKKKDVDIELKLQELEKKETNQQSDVEESDKNEGESEEKDADEHVEDEEEVVDEEMDDGTDYVNNYFDNGEGYDDEDDNLDDGPIY